MTKLILAMILTGMLNVKPIQNVTSTSVAPVSNYKTFANVVGNVEPTCNKEVNGLIFSFSEKKLVIAYGEEELQIAMLGQGERKIFVDIK